MQLMDLAPDLQATILAARVQFGDNSSPLTQFLPNQTVQDFSWRLARSQRLDQTAPVRAFDSPATPIRRPGVVDVQGDLPSVQPIEWLTETDLMKAQRLANFSVDLGPSIAVAAGRVARTVDNTFEQMRGQALSSGSVTLALENGTSRTVDFGVDEANKFTVPVAWTDPAYDGDPFDDLSEIHERFVESAGDDAGAMLTTRRVVTLLGDFLHRKYTQQPIGLDAVAGELARRNLPQPTTYDKSFTNYEGQRQRVFPQGAITFLPSGDPVGRTELGITQEAIQQVQGGVLTADSAAGLTIVTLGQDNPIQRAVKGAAIGLPVIQDADAVVFVNGITGA